MRPARQPQTDNAAKAAKAAKVAAATGKHRPLLSSLAFLLSCALLSLALFTGGDIRFAAAAAACLFFPRTPTPYFTVGIFILLGLFAWGALLAAVLLLAVLLAELWAASNRARQCANLAAAALCMTVLLFAAIPAICVYIDPISLSPAVLLTILAVLAILELIARRDATPPPQADPLLIILLAALAMCYLLVVALLAASIAYPQAILLAAVGGGVMLAAAAVLIAPLFPGGALSALQHIFALHVPIDTWVADISAAAAKESSATAFASAVIERFLQLPGIIGIQWQLNGDEQRRGEQGKHSIDLHCPPLFIRLYRSRRASPWDWFNYYLLARISSEYCRAKQREEQQRADNLSRAVHQTGARLTHDIKNILHTLTALAQAKDDGVIKRQLPVLRERLESTLAKLQLPVPTPAPHLAAAGNWWQRIRARHDHQPVTFSAETVSGDLPADVFDLAADNFIANAVIKQQGDPQLRIDIRLKHVGGRPALQVEDSGNHIDAATAAALFRQPIESTTGFGVGLYQVQLEAAKHGYHAALISNEDGKVIFQLSAAD